MTMTVLVAVVVDGVGTRVMVDGTPVQILGDC